MNTLTAKIKAPKSRLTGPNINLFTEKDDFDQIKTSGGAKRILIVSHSYVPMLSPRSFRWSAIANHWASEGFTVDVVTSWIPGTNRNETINGVNVIRVGGAISEKLRWALRSNDRTTTASKLQSNSSMKGRVISIAKTFLRFIHNALWKSIYWPDYACLWIKPATKESKILLDSHNYDALITVSDPFSSHLVGRKLNKAHPTLHWMVDLGDPFCFRTDTPANNDTLYSNLSRSIERKIFAAADEVSVTTETTRRKYVELFPESDSKIRVIPPLMAPVASNSETNQTEPKEDSTAFKLVFVGTLYKSIRNPEKLLKLFTGLVEHFNSQDQEKNLELHFYGGIDGNQEFFEPYKSMMNRNLFVHGLVSRQEALDAMNTADILVNIGNDNPYQLPSKIIEYACTGKPIVNLYSHSEDCSREFLSEYPLALNINGMDQQDSAEHGAEQEEQMIAFIDSLPIEIDKTILSNLRSKYETSAISDSYLQQIAIQTQTTGGGQ